MLAGVHKLVLEGKAPGLATFYPSVGGKVDLEGVWNSFNQTVHDNLSTLSRLIIRPVQMNDVDRSVGLLGGFAAVANQTRLPFRLLEIGSSGGLNLLWNHYHYQWKDGSWGDTKSTVRFTNISSCNHPSVPSNIEIVERLGCDLNPIDITTSEGKLALLSYAFPDEKDRIQRMNAAIAIGVDVRCKIDRANSADWLQTQLQRAREGTVTVIFHSIVWQYMSGSEQQRTASIIQEAGAAASQKAPLAWLTLEPGPKHVAKDGYEIRLRIYPGFRERLLAMFHHACHVPSVEWLLS
jgi:hypothetical protein